MAMGFPERVERVVLERSRWSCCVCHRVQLAFYLDGAELHHIQPAAEGGADTWDNAALLCERCREAHGADPAQRDFIRGARDAWYDACAREAAADAETRAKMEEALANPGRGCLPVSAPHTREEIEAAWRALRFLAQYQEFAHRPDPGLMVEYPGVVAILRDGSAHAAREAFGEGCLAPLDDVEFARLQGKLAALTWVLSGEMNDRADLLRAKDLHDLHRNLI
jgi:hypothetical protein